jgi:hypothetical protein
VAPSPAILASSVSSTVRSAGAGDPPTASFTISAEDGTIFGIVGIQTDQPASEFGIGDLVSALPGGIGPSFGSALVVIAASAGHGLRHVTYSAEGRYSIGMPASCQTPAP